MSIHRDKSLKVLIDLKAGTASSPVSRPSLTAKMYAAGEEYTSRAVKKPREFELGAARKHKYGVGSGLQGEGGRLQGVVAFECIASANVRRDKLEFCEGAGERGKEG